MSQEIKYDRDQVWRQEPDCYSGKSCSSLRPRWITSYPKEGDCDEGEELELKIHARKLPPGSRVVVEIPCCPKCGVPAIWNEPKRLQRTWPPCECGFSWGKWAREQFS